MSYEKGNAWFTCDRCGQQYRRKDLCREWDGLIVDPACLDPRPAELSPPRVWPEGLPFYNARPDQNPYVSPGRFISTPVTRDDL